MNLHRTPIIMKYIQYSVKSEKKNLITHSFNFPKWHPQFLDTTSLLYGIFKGATTAPLNDPREWVGTK